MLVGAPHKACDLSCHVSEQVGRLGSNHIIEMCPFRFSVSPSNLCCIIIVPWIHPDVCWCAGRRPCALCPCPHPGCPLPGDGDRLLGELCTDCWYCARQATIQQSVINKSRYMVKYAGKLYVVTNLDWH